MEPSEKKLLNQLCAWPEVAEGLVLPAFEGFFDRSETGLSPETGRGASGA
jgi:hypothetical protein